MRQSFTPTCVTVVQPIIFFRASHLEIKEKSIKILIFYKQICEFSKLQIKNKIPRKFNT